MKRERVPERAQLPSLRLEGLINQLLRTLTAPLPAPRATLHENVVRFDAAQTS